MPVSCNTEMTLGTICVAMSARKTTSLRTLKQQYGDGYVARRQDGLNPVMEKWEVSTIPMSYEEAQGIEDALIDLGVTPFAWTPPNETASKNWILDPNRWEWDYATCDLVSLSFVLKRWYQ